MHGDFAEVSNSLIDLSADCEASDLITQALENPGNASQGQALPGQKH